MSSHLDCRGTDLQMQSSIPKVPAVHHINSTLAPGAHTLHALGDTGVLQLFGLKNSSASRDAGLHSFMFKSPSSILV